MAHSVALQRERDKKEREISTMYEAERINKDQLIRIQNDVAESMKEYQQWKKDNDIPGIKY